MPTQTLISISSAGPSRNGSNQFVKLNILFWFFIPLMYTHASMTTSMMLTIMVFEVAGWNPSSHTFFGSDLPSYTACHVTDPACNSKNVQCYCDVHTFDETVNALSESDCSSLVGSMWRHHSAGPGCHSHGELPNKRPVWMDSASGEGQHHRAEVGHYFQSLKKKKKRAWDNQCLKQKKMVFICDGTTSHIVIKGTSGDK